MGLRYVSANGGPVCYESADVRIVDGVRDIPYEGSLAAVLVPTDNERGCNRIGLIFDDRTTLVVECLHGEEAIRAFRSTCAVNRIETVAELATVRPDPCPPPPNQLQVEDWALKLFSELRPPS